MRKYIIIFAVSLFLFIANVNAVTKAPVDVTVMSIEEIMDAMDKGYLNSETLVNIYLERIEAYDEMFNSINQLNEHALEEAKKLDKERENGQIRGRLHGIPILVKCNIDVYGMPTTAGTKSLKDNFPKQNSYVVQKLIDEGAIILGSTNMSELAFSAANSYSSYGYVRNVFNTDYTSYGSSGGSAVAVKASFAVASLGTDTNSSVRLPASGAGLVGMRPTLGLVSRTGVIPYDIERDTVGVLSRNVEDNVLLLNIISGYDESDSITKNAKKPNSDLSKSSLKGVTIGVATQYVNGSENGFNKVVSLTDADIYKLLEKSIKELEEAGATIVYVDDFVKSSNLTIATNTYAGRTMCDYFNEYIKGTTGDIRSFQELANSKGHVQGLSGYKAACGDSATSKDKRDARKAKYRNYVEDYFEEHDLDVLLYPTLKNKVFKYNQTGNISPGSSLGSVIGFPSITVPMGYVNEFSYGIEFLSTAYKEDVLYNVAYEYEKANGNEVNTSNLTPSLYKIPDSVTKLILRYEDILNYDKKNKTVDKWLEETEKYLKNYNNIEDVEIEANKLLNISDDIEKVIVFNNVNNYYEYFVLLLGIIALLVIFREVSKGFK